MPEEVLYTSCGFLGFFPTKAKEEDMPKNWKVDELIKECGWLPWWNTQAKFADVPASWDRTCKGKEDNSTSEWTGSKKCSKTGCVSGYIDYNGQCTKITDCRSAISQPEPKEAAEYVILGGIGSSLGSGGATLDSHCFVISHSCREPGRCLARSPGVRRRGHCPS